MKRSICIILAAMLFLCVYASAETVKPIAALSMEDDLSNGVFNVGFKASDVNEDGIALIEVYTELRYELDEIDALQTGDTIEYVGGEVTVESVEKDYCVYINGNAEDGAEIRLIPEGGTYLASEYELTVYQILGCMDLPFAKEVIYRHWQTEEDGTILPDLAVTTVSGAEIARLLNEDECEAFGPEETTILVLNGEISEINILYTP